MATDDDLLHEQARQTEEDRLVDEEAEHARRDLARRHELER